ncbi:probable serine/threonine-protein kinase irlB [Helianthus annuus]|uniref:probable serine/threonine-protein kinase irlB n=1 Tax=Helianthus annuus TaxID=4232 RepID=UPI000B8EEB09|nr:probable serine/threonine-protein kinase irlB [Helianthus annuus]
MMRKNKIEMLKEKRAARLKRELEELEARRIAEEKEKMEAEKAKTEEKPTEKAKVEEKKDKKYSELDELKEKLLFDVKYVNESYDVLNRTVDSLNKTNLEVEAASTMMSSTLMTKQKAINHYIEECAKLKQDLETEKIENERIR